MPPDVASARSATGVAAWLLVAVPVLLVVGDVVLVYPDWVTGVPGYGAIGSSGCRCTAYA